jgi:hypothetical protein
MRDIRSGWLSTAAMGRGEFQISDEDSGNFGKGLSV